MKLSQVQNKPFISLGSRWPLNILFIFTLLSGIGYATFGRHPEWLQFLPAPLLLPLSQFFGAAFTFFAQGHIWLSVGVLVLYLTRNTGTKWIPAFIAIYVLSLASELSGTWFGIPFGEYNYTELLGVKWFNLVPILIPMSWFTMALPSFALSNFAFPGSTQRIKRIAFAAFLLTLWDLSLDPAMSYLTPYWVWGETGPYYNMPWINLGGWYLTGIVLMTALQLLNTDRWTARLSIRWLSTYYGLVLLLPLFMSLAAGLWFAIAVTLAAVIPAAWLIDRNYKKNSPDDFSQFGTLSKIKNNQPQSPDEIKSEKLKDYFSSHSRSFSFAARFFSTDQYQLVTRLYAFCRTTDDIADTIAPLEGRETAEAQLDEWEQRVFLSYQGIPSGIDWLDELMARSNQCGVPFDLIQDLIAGVRTDLREVEIHSIDELDRYCYCVASVVGIWLCYLFGVRDREVLERASAMGRAMQVTNILRDVGEDLRMGRVYLPTETMIKYGVTRDSLHEMEAGTLSITDGYRTLIEDLMERAEADYQYAFRGLSAIPVSFARAAAVASEVYKGIHKSVRRNNYDNFRRRAYTRLYEKIYLSLRAIRKLKQIQNRPFISAAEPVFFSHQQLSNNHRRQKPLIVSFITLILGFQSLTFPGDLSAQYATPAPALTNSTDTTYTVPPQINITDFMDPYSSFLDHVRTLYVSGVEDASAIDEGLRLIESAPYESALLEAYAAAMTVLKAKHAFWPAKKMRYLREGLPQLDTLVAQNPSDVKIRYLRLLSCYYLPRFLGFSDTVEEDTQKIATLLPEQRHQLPQDLYFHIAEFVSNARDLSEEDRVKFDSLIIGNQSPANTSKAFKTYE